MVKKKQNKLYCTISICILMIIFIFVTFFVYEMNKKLEIFTHVNNFQLFTLIALSESFIIHIFSFTYPLFRLRFLNTVFMLICLDVSVLGLCLQERCPRKSKIHPLSNKNSKHTTSRFMFLSS